MMEQWFARRLIDLPDEIIMFILNKLDNVDVLYSLMNVHTQLNRILHDPMLTTKIALIKPTDELLDRFCLQILPQIHRRIQWLSLESTSMERVLLSAAYPNLRQLHIFITDTEPLELLTDKSALVHIFHTQIVTLSINGDMDYAKHLMIKLAKFFAYILTTFTSILHLKFYESYPGVLFDDRPSVFSSTLTELHIDVHCLDDCLYLLDGQLNQLQTLFVKIRLIFPLRAPINNKEELPNLKHFSAISINSALAYDELFVPMLQRMLNLEKLALALLIDREERFVDGNDLKNNIVNHMPRLREFTFNIRSTIKLDNQIHLPSNEDMQHTLTDLTDHRIISCVDYFSHEKIGQCHFYTYPYTVTRYENISNKFPGGVFECVRCVTLFDEHPFEHIFFYRIAQAFPFLLNLTVCNWKPQNHAQDQDRNDDTQDSLMIKFPHLTELHLLNVHHDYIEQFLVDAKTYLPNLTYLLIKIDQLKRVTHNFTRNATRLNCAKIKDLYIKDRSDLPEHFHIYFPLVK